MVRGRQYVRQGKDMTLPQHLDVECEAPQSRGVKEKYPRGFLFDARVSRAEVKSWVSVFPCLASTNVYIRQVGKARGKGSSKSLNVFAFPGNQFPCLAPVRLKSMLDPNEIRQFEKEKRRAPRTDPNARPLVCSFGLGPCAIVVTVGFDRGKYLTSEFVPTIPDVRTAFEGQGVEGEGTVEVQPIEHHLNRVGLGLGGVRRLLGVDRGIDQTKAEENVADDLRGVRRSGPEPKFDRPGAMVVAEVHGTSTEHPIVRGNLGVRTPHLSPTLGPSGEVVFVVDRTPHSPAVRVVAARVGNETENRGFELVPDLQDIAELKGREVGDINMDVHATRSVDRSVPRIVSLCGDQGGVEKFGCLPRFRDSFLTHQDSARKFGSSGTIQLQFPLRTA